jgi:hypothetical protein
MGIPASKNFEYVIAALLNTSSHTKVNNEKNRRDPTFPQTPHSNIPGKLSIPINHRKSMLATILSLYLKVLPGRNTQKIIQQSTYVKTRENKKRNMFYSNLSPICLKGGLEDSNFTPDYRCKSTMWHYKSGNFMPFETNENINDLASILALLQDSEVYYRRTAIQSISHVGGKVAVDSFVHILSTRGVEMRTWAAKELGRIKGWDDIDWRTQASATNALLRSLETHHYCLLIEAVDSLNKIGDYKILSKLYANLYRFKYDDTVELIFNIQSKCDFYSYDIFCISPNSQQFPSTNLTFNIDKLGNLNTGPVNIQGHQVGIQRSADPQ